MTTKTRPNIIYINPDQMRADALGCYGHPVVQTPNFDRLTAMAQAMRLRLGDRALGIAGHERRPIGQVAQADTLTHYNPAHPYIIAEYDLADAG